MKDVFKFDLVHVQIAPDGDEQGFTVGHIEDCLQGFKLGHTEELGQSRDGLDARSGDLFQRLFEFCLHFGVGRFGLLSVGSIGTRRTGDNGVLAGVGGQQELVGVFATNGPAIRLSHQHGQAAAPEDIAVGLGHSLVALV